MDRGTPRRLNPSMRVVQRADGDIDEEGRASADRRADADGMAEDAGKALDDGKAEADALASRLAAGTELAELLEDLLGGTLGNADTAVADLDPDDLPPPAAASSTRPTAV